MFTSSPLYRYRKESFHFPWPSLIAFIVFPTLGGLIGNLLGYLHTL